MFIFHGVCHYNRNLLSCFTICHTTRLFVNPHHSYLYLESCKKKSLSLVPISNTIYGPISLYGNKFVCYLNCLFEMLYHLLHYNVGYYPFSKHLPFRLLHKYLVRLIHVVWVYYFDILRIYEWGLNFLKAKTFLQKEIQNCKLKLYVQKWWNMLKVFDLNIFLTLLLKAIFIYFVWWEFTYTNFSNPSPEFLQHYMGSYIWDEFKFL